MPVERAMALGECSKEPVEEIKSNAEVLVHAAAFVYRPRVNIVKSACLAEPRPQNGSPLHPEALNVHAIVKVAEHEGRPSHQCGEGQTTVRKTHAQQPHAAAADGKNQGCGSEPLQTNVSDCRSA